MNKYFFQLGMIGGNQEISLEIPGCLSKDTIAHEFIHALGKTRHLIYKKFKSFY